MNFAVWLEILCAPENCGPYTLHPDWAQTETSLVRDLGIVQLNLRGFVENMKKLHELVRNEVYEARLGLKQVLESTAKCSAECKQFQTTRKWLILEGK